MAPRVSVEGGNVVIDNAGARKPLDQVRPRRRSCALAGWTLRGVHVCAASPPATTPTPGRSRHADAGQRGRQWRSGAPAQPCELEAREDSLRLDQQAIQLGWAGRSISSRPAGRHPARACYDFKAKAERFVVGGERLFVVSELQERAQGKTASRSSGTNISSSAVATTGAGSTIRANRETRPVGRQ